MLVDFKIGDKGDSGVYLRGTPQVQIWDISRTDVGAEVGSGGLYNNQKHPSDPLTVADMPVGDWNHMKIQMMDEKVTVCLMVSWSSTMWFSRISGTGQSRFSLPDRLNCKHMELILHSKIFTSKKFPRAKIF